MKAKIFRKTGRTGYVCGCGKRHLFSVYAIAQTAMGNDLRHFCDCGRQNTVVSTATVLIGAPDRLAANVVESP